MAAPRTTPEQVALGRALRMKRTANALSQEELGHRAGLHRNYVGGVERGELNPSYQSLLKLAKGVEVKLSELVALAERTAAE